MNKVKKSLSVFALAGAVAAGSFFGANVVRDTQFAFAQKEVQTSQKELATAADLAGAFKEVGKAVEPSVVMLEVRKTIKGVSRSLPFSDEDLLRRFFGDRDNDGEPDLPGRGPNGDDSFEQKGTGSGVIMEVDGSTAWILTNNHVAGGAAEMLITLADGRQVKNAKVVGTDPKSDLALLKVQVDRVIPAKWGDSSTLEKGDWVMAFGSPFGYVGSMTHGIVSALNRDVGVLARQEGYESFIQVDAPINPGNSGGPLVNLKGEVVGINTAIASRSGGFQGVGFAIPSSQAKFVYSQLKDNGKVTRGWLGVSIASVNDPRGADIARSFGYEEANGVLVHDVLPGTPAAGKLQEGDIITKINGKKLRDAQTLRNMVAAFAPNTEVTMTVFRDGKTSDVKLKLGEQPQDLKIARGGRGGDAGEPAEIQGLDKLGIKLQDVTEELAQKFELGDGKKGALVTSVEPRSLAATSGLRPGDLITNVAGKEIKSAAEARDALKGADLAKGVRIRIVSPDGSRFVVLKDEK